MYFLYLRNPFISHLSTEAIQIPIVQEIEKSTTLHPPKQTPSVREW